MTRSGLRFWIDPGPVYEYDTKNRIHELTGVCLRQGSGPCAGSCSHSLASVLASGLWATTALPDGKSVIYGIVPDTNQTITVRRRAGGTQTVSVVLGVVVTPLGGVSELLVKGVTGKISTVHLQAGATRVSPAK